MANPVIKLLRGVFAKKPTLDDGVLFIDKTNHNVIVGDDAAAGGEFTLANASAVEAVEQDVADIMVDYAKTSGGNTLPASKSVVTNADGKLVDGDATSTEVGYLSGVTSAIQAQIDSKITTPDPAPTANQGVRYNGTKWVASDIVRNVVDQTTNGAIKIGTTTKDTSSGTAYGIGSLSGKYGYAQGDHSIAVGSSATTYSSSCLAIGKNTEAGVSGHASETSETSDDVGSVAFGYGCKATNYCAIAGGHSCEASGMHSVSLGHSSLANKEDSIALGRQPKATGLYSVAIGTGATASAQSSVAIGSGATANKANQIKIGGDNSAVIIGAPSFVLKSSTTASTKMFKITVDDSGAITATEYTA